MPQKSSPVFTHGKTVELIELFNDLIYVYSISQMTSLLTHPASGELIPMDVFGYLIACLVVLQAWLFQTNYVNRFGRGSWPERIVVCANMIAALYVSNTINGDWDAMARPFSAGMCAMFATTALLYFMHSRRSEPGARFARNVTALLAAFACAYLAAALAAPALPGGTLSVFLPAMVVVGAIAPSFVKGGFDPAFVDAGHLVERFELLVILTFGEMVVAMTGLFDVAEFSLASVIIFVNVFLLFGTYVLFVHHMLDHHLKGRRGLTLMYAHFAMVIGVNMLTVAMEFTHEEGDVAVGLAMLVVSSVLFYAALCACNVYAKQGMALSEADFGFIAAIVAAGLALTVLARDVPYGMLVGVFIVHLGVFGVFERRYRIGCAAIAGDNSDLQPPVGT